MGIYHQILGISENTSIEEIKLKYRKLCKQYHPDLNNNDFTHKMALINEAYDGLIKKRSLGKVSNQTPKVFQDRGIELYPDQAFAFYRQANNLILEIHKMQESIKMFNNSEFIGKYETTVFKALYYLNIVCMEYDNSEYYEDSIKKIKELNRDRIIAKNVKEYNKRLHDMGDSEFRVKHT